MKQAAPAAPDTLAQNPELVVLSILDHTLQQAAYTLYGLHPELVDPHKPIPARDINAALCLADTIADQIASLQRTLDRYREVVATGEDPYLLDVLP
jgi:hypothetical protein